METVILPLLRSNSIRHAIRLVVALGVLLMTASVCRAQPVEQGLCAEVPETSWSYDAVTQLVQRGLATGYPSAAFCGRVARTRREFALAVSSQDLAIRRELPALLRRMDKAQKPEHSGTPTRKGNHFGGLSASIRKSEKLALARTLQVCHDDLDKLKRLLLEFAPELEALGTNPKQHRDSLQALSQEVVSRQRSLPEPAPIAPMISSLGSTVRRGEPPYPAEVR